MLEHVGHVRRPAASVDELSRHELGEALLEHRRRQVRYRFNHLLRELSADRRSDLRDRPRRGEPIEPRHERILKRGRNGQRRQRALKDVATVILGQQARLQHHLQQFLDEQRHAVGLLDDLSQYLRREGGRTNHLRDHRFGIRPRKAGEVQLRYAGATRPW